MKYDVNAVGIPQMVVLTNEQLNQLLEAAAERAVEKYREAESKTVKACDDVPVSDEDRYLTPAEAAKMFRVDTSTLWRWRGLGLPYLEIGPRKVLYKLSDLLKMSKQKGKHNKNQFAGNGGTAETDERKEEPV